jgi:hypothetical protein
MFVKSFSLFAIIASIARFGPAAAFAPVPPTHIFTNIRNRVTKTNLNMADFTLEPSDSALVLIEYQNEFATEGGKLHEAVKECMDSTGMLSTSKKMMDFAREAGLTIIHVPINFEPVRVSTKMCVA